MTVSAETLTAFVAASILLLIIPGPTIIMVVSQALAHGRRVAFASIAGVALGDLSAATLSVVGVGTLLAASATVFTLLKWAGAAYLIYIGVRLWMTPVRVADIEAAREPGGTGSLALFRDAFLVTLLNPKGIVFFVAFVPQFIDPAQAYAPQAALFVAVFVALGIVNAYAYVTLADRARDIVRRPAILRTVTRAGAAALIAAGFASLLARRA